MQNTLKQFKKIARETYLSAEEKSSMREEILQYMKANPVRNGVSPRHPLVKRHGSIPSPFSLISKFRNIKTMPVLIILGLLMGGSASFAAENAVPGDVLFPVKIYVNENVRGAVAVTPRAKAQWEVALVGRRLEEIEKLAALSNVTPEVKEIAQNNLEKYTERAKEHISRFENENDDEDALTEVKQLTKVLSAHEAILSALDAGQTALGRGVATTTLATTATTTGSALNATSTTGTTNTENISSLDAVLKTLHEVREYSERKNKEIERKHSSREEEEHTGSEEKSLSVDGISTTTSSIGEERDRKNRGEWTDNEETMNDDEEDGFSIPSLPPITSTTTNGTISTTTATTTVVTPSRKDEDDHDHINGYSSGSTTMNNIPSPAITNTVFRKVEDDIDSSKDSKSSHSETKEVDHN